MPDDDSEPLVASVAAAVDDVLERLGSDDASADRTAELQGVCSTSPAAVRDELERLAATLHERTDNGESADVDPGATSNSRTGTPAGASRALYGLFTRGTDAIVAAAPDATWTAIDAAVGVADGSGPASTYARAFLHGFPLQDPSTSPAAAAVSLGGIRERLHDPAPRQAAAGFCRWQRSDYIPDAVLPELGECLVVSDVETRRLAVKALDYAYEFDPAPVASRLLEAANDEDPVVRAGAIGALCTRLWLRDDVPEWGHDAMRALADGLDDDHPTVRVRAAGVLGYYPSYLGKSQFWNALDSATRGRLLQGAIQVESDPTPHDGVGSPGRTLVGIVSAADTWQVRDALRTFAWPDESSEGETDDQRTFARKALAQAAEADPAGIDDPAWYIDRIVDDTTEGVSQNEARLLAVLAAIAPEPTAETIPALVATLETDDPTDASREAARALGVLEGEGEPVPVDRATLVAAIGDTIRHGYLQEGRLAALAVVDHEAASDVLDTVLATPDEYSRGIPSAVQRLAESNPELLARHVDGIIGTLDVLGSRRRERLLWGLTTIAEHDPQVVAPYADRIADALASLHLDTRLAAAAVLRTVGAHDPSSVPHDVSALLRTSEDASGTDLLSVIASEDPNVARRILVNALDSDPFDRLRHGRRYGQLLAAVAAGEPALGRLGLDELLVVLVPDARQREDPRASRAVGRWESLGILTQSPDEHGVAAAIASFAEARPELAVGGLDRIVDILIDPDVADGPKQYLQETLGHIATTHPSQAKHAVRDRFPDDWDARTYGEVVGELVAAAPAEGRSLVESLFAHLDDRSEAATALQRFAWSQPEAASAFAPEYIEALSRDIPHGVRDLSRALGSITANGDPRAVREALTERYERPTAFVNDVPYQVDTEKILQRTAF